MPLLSLLREELWRRIITEYYQAEANLIKLVPIESYKSEEAAYFVQKTLATTPGVIAPGAGFPISMGTYEKGTVSLEMYGLGIEIHKHDIDWRRFNVLRRELRQKAQGMALYQDQKISLAMDAVTENIVDGSGAGEGWDDDVVKILPDVAEAIRLIKEDNIPGGATDLVVSPLNHQYILTSLTGGAITTVPAGVVRDGKVITYLGLNVWESNNLATAVNAFVVARNLFGWMPQAYPISTLPPELVRELMVYRAFTYAMDGFVLDQPKAVTKIITT